MGRYKTKPLPPLEELKKYLSYNPVTGVFLCVFSRRKGHSGRVAGTKHEGYIRIDTPLGRFSAHRLAWRFIYGDESGDDFEPDHKDRNGFNNAAANLRIADPSQQCANRRHALPKRSGLRGAVWKNNHKTKKWCAATTVKRKPVHIGYFDTAEEAHQAYMEFGRKTHGEFFL